MTKSGLSFSTGIRSKWFILHCVAVSVFGISFLIYLNTLAPGLVWEHYGQDGGELISASIMLGVAHPPGYPTYLMLGNLFSRVTFFDDAAFTFNMFSALSASISVVGFYYLTNILSNMIARSSKHTLLIVILSACSSLTFATSSIFWSQAVIAEVYTMNSLFFCLALLLAVMNSGIRSPKGNFDSFRLGGANDVGKRLAGWLGRYGVLLSGVCIGVGMGNHLTIVFLLAPILLFYFYVDGIKIGPLFTFVGGVIAGLTVYFYLPLRAGVVGLPINWGDTDTLKGFIWQITAVPYQDKVFGISSGEIWDRLSSWAWMTVDQVTLLGILMCIVGLLGLSRVWPSIAITKINITLIYIIYSVSYATSDSYTYLIPVYGVMAVLLGVGWYVFGSELIRRIAVEPRRQVAVWALILSMAITLPVFNLVANYSNIDVSQDTQAEDYVHEVFDTIDPDSVLIATGDNEVFAIWYGHYTERLGPKVSVIVAPLLQYDWYWETLTQQNPGRMPSFMPDGYEERIMEIVKKNVYSRSVYLNYEDASVKNQFKLEPVERVYRVGIPVE